MPLTIPELIQWRWKQRLASDLVRSIADRFVAVEHEVALAHDVRRLLERLDDPEVVR